LYSFESTPSAGADLTSYADVTGVSSGVVRTELFQGYDGSE